MATLLLVATLAAAALTACAGRSTADRPPGAPAVRIAQASGGVNAPAVRSKPTVILISFDGMRYDYLDRGITPNLERLARSGVRAQGLIPIFPSTTFPNHYSIATGMYADRNGIANNRFLARDIDAFYVYTDSTKVRDARFYSGEPIWNTAEKQGMVAATFFWVGSEAPVGGIRATTVWNYDESIADSTRLRALGELLRQPPETRPHFVAVYFADVDAVSHRNGPDSPETNRAIARADSILGVIARIAAALPPSDSVSIVVVSDHGMINAPNKVVIQEYTDTAGVTITTGPVASLWYHGDSARIRRARSDLERMPHARVYLRSELPAEWHYDTPRSGDVIIVAEPGWYVDIRSRSGLPGAHGYPPAVQEMQGIFVAAGPRIRAGVRIGAFENVHVYPLLAELLRIVPGEVDGNLGVLRPILKN
jgi:predicted AlkP superfamily pyrophosphatase or phosphodiesterase